MTPANTAPAVSTRLHAKRRGFNLVEAAIVLGVVGLVIGGIWVAAAAVQENNKRQTFIAALLTTSTNLQNLYKNMPPRSSGTPWTIYYSANSSYSSPPTILNVPVGAWEGTIPGSLIDNNKDTPQSPWGRNVVISVQASLILFETSVPLSTCISIAPLLAVATAKISPDSPFNTPNNVRTVPGGSAGTPDTANTACNTGNSGGWVTMWIMVSR